MNLSDRNTMHPLTGNFAFVAACGALDTFKHGVGFWCDLAPEVDQRDRHGLGNLCGLLAGRLAQYAPIHIGPEFFALNASDRFNVWAVFRGNLGVAPLIDYGMAGKAKGAS